MATPNVGSAYVSVRSDTRGFAQTLRRQLERQLGDLGEAAGERFNQGFASAAQDLGQVAEQSFATAGRQSGQQFSLRFNRAAEQRIATFANAFRRVLADGSGDAGEASAQMYLGRLSREFEATSLDLARPLFADLEMLAGRSGRRSGARYASAAAEGVGDAGRLFLNAVQSIFRGVRNLARSQGESSGGAFSSGFNDTINLDFGPINLRFRSLSQAIVRLLTPAVAAAQALGGLAAQAAALVSSLSSAVSATALFIPLITTLGTAIGVAVIGFQGFASAVSEGGEALANLQPSAQAAANALRSLRDEFTQIQDVVQQRLFVDLAEPLRELANTILPVVQQQFANTASVINGFLVSFTRFAQSSRNVEDLNTILASQNTILASLLASVQPLVAAFRDWLVPMLPLAERLADAIRRGAQQLAAFAEQGRQTGATADFFARAYENAATLLAGLRDLTVGIVNFFSAGREEGAAMLETFARLSAEFRAFAQSAEGQQAFQQFFEFGAVVVQRLAAALQVLFNVFQPVVSAISQVLGAAAPLLDIFVALSETIGGVLTTVLAPITQLLTNLFTIFARAANEILPVVQAGLAGLGAAFGSLLTAIVPLATQMYEAIIPALLQLLPPIIRLGTTLINALTPAITAVVTAFSRIIPIVIESLVPAVISLIGVIGQAVAALAPLIADLVSALAPILVRVTQLIAAALPVVTALAEGIIMILVPILGRLIKEVTIVIERIASAIETVISWGGPIRAVAQLIAGRFVSAIQSGIDFVSSLANGIQDAIEWLQDFLSPIRSVASAFAGRLSDAISGAVGFVQDIIGAIQSAIDWFRDFIAPVRDAASAFGPLEGAVSGALGVIDGIAGAVSGAIGAINELIDAIQSIPSLPELPGYSNPFIPFLASGAIVNGPTRAMVGEAGREAVIPLDRPLPLVDPSVRAMAALLRGDSRYAAGGIAGGGRSVTVLPGAINVTAPYSNPALVAEQVMDRLVVETATG